MGKPGVEMGSRKPLGCVAGLDLATAGKKREKSMRVGVRAVVRGHLGVALGLAFPGTQPY